jgi:hypothetical protein
MTEFKAPLLPDKVADIVTDEKEADEKEVKYQLHNTFKDKVTHYGGKICSINQKAITIPSQKFKMMYCILISSNCKI